MALACLLRDKENGLESRKSNYGATGVSDS